MTSSGKRGRPGMLFIGTILHSKSLSELEILEPGLLLVNDEGRIDKILSAKDLDVEQWVADHHIPTDQIHRLSASQFLVPGLVDTHIHAPQYVFTGTGYDGTLLHWLNTYTFPREAAFASETYATENYAKAVLKTLQCGTTTACYYGTLHTNSTKILADTIHRLGQRAFVGKVNMNRNSPDYYIESSTDDSIEGTLEVIQHIQGLHSSLITPVITPRFVPSCTVDLMKRLGHLAKEHNLPIQSHLSETPGEIAWVKELHPECSSYAMVYETYGLFNSQTIMAHCVHMTTEERALAKANQVGISHCPSSNFCLQSGALNVRRLLEEGIDKIGLGTDVGGGYSPSIFDAIRQAITASKVVHFQSRDGPQLEEKDAPENKVYDFLSLPEAFYLATLGGAKVLNLESKIGNFTSGKDFDALILDHGKTPTAPQIDTFPHDTTMNRFEKLVYLGDDRHIAKVYVAGSKVLG